MCEQGRTRFQLQTIRGTENLFCRQPIDSDHGIRTFQQSRSKDSVLKVRSGFRDGLDRVFFRSRTERQSIQLREDVPHPM